MTLIIESNISNNEHEKETKNENEEINYVDDGLILDENNISKKIHEMEKIDKFKTFLLNDGENNEKNSQYNKQIKDHSISMRCKKKFR